MKLVKHIFLTSVISAALTACGTDFKFDSETDLPEIVIINDDHDKDLEEIAEEISEELSEQPSDNARDEESSQKESNVIVAPITPLNPEESIEETEVPTVPDIPDDIDEEDSSGAENVTEAPEPNELRIEENGFFVIDLENDQSCLTHFDHSSGYTEIATSPCNSASSQEWLVDSLGNIHPSYDRLLCVTTSETHSAIFELAVCETAENKFRYTSSAILSGEYSLSLDMDSNTLVLREQDTEYSQWQLRSKHLLSNNFEQHDQGPYTSNEFQDDWSFSPNTSAGVKDGRLGIVEMDDGNQARRVQYEALGYGGSTASVFRYEIPGEANESLWLQYEVQFPEDFDWVKGGKLPGLSGYENGVKPTGCVSNTNIDGFSARFMWRENGQILQYLYNPLKREHCGDYFAMKQFLQKGRWHTITSYIQLNSTDQDDGVIKAYLDGELVLEIYNLKLRTHEGVSIDKFLFETFFGGGSSWAPLTEQHVYFDNIVISKSSPLYLVNTLPQNADLSELDDSAFVEWNSNSSYNQNSLVYLMDGAKKRYFEARYGIAAGKNPLTNSMPAKFAKVYHPVRLDTGEPWLEF